MKIMKNNKTPSNDQLTKESYKAFWEELKNSPTESVNLTFQYKTLGIWKKLPSSSLKRKTGWMIHKEMETNFIVKCWQKNLSNFILNKLKTVLTWC